MNKLVVLMPLSQYKAKGLYKYVDSFELADPKLFEDAVITENLCICTLRKYTVDKYTWQDLVLKSVDQSCVELYKWNILHDCSSVNSHIGQITFTTAKARDNFAICWYSGDNNRKHLLGRAASGIRIQEVSAEYYFFIPQIDWENIHINQKELWDKGDYDNAVLAEMGLKFDENGVIVKC